MIWLRLGGALNFSFVLSQCAFGIAGAWQLIFAETAPQQRAETTSLPLPGALRYACSRGIPVLLTYLIVGYFALTVVVPLCRNTHSRAIPTELFVLEATRAWSTIKMLGAESILRAPSLGMHLTLTIGAALVEELFWRGYVQPIWCMACLASKKPERLGIFLQALAFGAAHVASDLDLSRMATALPGLWFGYAAFRTGGLVAPAVLHVGCNLAAGLLHLGVTAQL